MNSSLISVFIQALAENKVLSVRGVNNARSVASILAEKGFGKLKYEGSQVYFEIDEDQVKTRAKELHLEPQVCQNKKEMHYSS